MSNKDDMSDTFVAEVGQKSAIFGSKKSKKDDVEVLDDTDFVNDDVENDEKKDLDISNDNEEVENNHEDTSIENDELFPEVKIDPPEEIPSVLNDSEDEKMQSNDNNIDDKFVLPENNEMNGEEKEYEEKKNPISKILLIIICLAIGASGSYYYFEIYNNKSVKKTVVKENKEETESVEEVNPDSRFITNLVEKYNGFNDGLDLFLTVLASDKTEITDLESDYLQVLGAYNIRNYTYFTEEDLQNSLNQLFGVDKVKASTKNIVVTNCQKYVYNGKSFSLEIKGTCNDTTLYFPKYKIVKAKKDNKKEELYINVALALADGRKVYKAYDKAENLGKDEVEEIDSGNLDMDKDYSKFNQYRYTYKYDKENNDYYLINIELEK